MSHHAFGKPTYDRCPDLVGRYHLVDEHGYISGKFTFGIYAYDAAGNASERTPDTVFIVIDTRDGSEYGACRNGEQIR